MRGNSKYSINFRKIFFISGVIIRPLRIITVKESNLPFTLQFIDHIIQLLLTIIVNN